MQQTRIEDIPKMRYYWVSDSDYIPTENQRYVGGISEAYLYGLSEKSNPYKWISEVEFVPNCEIYTDDDKFYADFVRLHPLEKIVDIEETKKKYMNLNNPVVGLVVVKKGARNLRDIENQTNEICLTAINLCGDSIQYVIDKNEELCLAAVKNQATALQYIRNEHQTPAVCLAAVDKLWDALKHVQNENQTEELCKFAIDKHSYAIQHMHQPSLDLRLRAVQKDGSVLTYLSYGQTHDIVLAAVKQNGLALKCASKYSNEIYLAAVKQNGLALQYVARQTDEICMAAVKQNGLALKWVHNQTNNKIIVAAIKQNPEAKQFKKINV